MRIGMTSNSGFQKSSKMMTGGLERTIPRSMTTIMTTITSLFVHQLRVQVKKTQLHRHILRYPKARAKGRVRAREGAVKARVSTARASRRVANRARGNMEAREAELVPSEPRQSIAFFYQDECPTVCYTSNEESCWLDGKMVGPWPKIILQCYQ